MKPITEQIDTTLFDKLVSETPETTNNFISHSLSIADKIYDYMKSNNISEKELADLLNYEEEDIEIMLSGFWNFDIKTLSKIEVALGINFNFSIINNNRKNYPPKYSFNN